MLKRRLPSDDLYGVDFILDVLLGALSAVVLAGTGIVAFAWICWNPADRPLTSSRGRLPACRARSLWKPG